MATDHLGRHALDHVTEGESTGLFRDARVEDDLEEQVTEFVPEILQVAPLDRVDDFVSLLQGVRGQADMGLQQVPRAT